MAIIFDTHAHLNFTVFDNDRDEIIKKCLKSDVWIVNVGTKYETSKKAVEIAQKHKTGVYAAVGLHPIHLEERKIDPFEVGPIRSRSSNGVNFQRVFKTSAEQFDYEKFKELAKSKKVVAIGEIGLDYYYKPKTKRKLELFKEKQRVVLCQQLDLARELNLPVIFHCRMAHADLCEVVKSKIKNQKSKIEGVIHCFTGTREEAKRYLEMGFYIGFNGIIFKLNLDEVIKNVPAERILVETDCPYLTPPNFPEERNNPLGAKYVLDNIAKMRNTSVEKLADTTTNNAKSLFKF